MGAKPSVLYSHCKRFLIRYNAENRAHKYLKREKLPVAPKHPLPERFSNETKLSKEELEALHGKNEKLSEYLKKVYLTSTSTVTGTPSKRPKPKKENEVLKKKMFLDPEKTTPGHCTLTQLVSILHKYQEDPEAFSISDTAAKFQLDKKDTGLLIMYYSLFTIEKFEFMNVKPQKDEGEDEEDQKVEFEVYSRLEKTPLRQIEGKK